VDPPTDAASELVQTGENSGKGASLLRATNRNSFNKFFRFRLKKKKRRKKNFFGKKSSNDDRAKKQFFVNDRSELSSYKVRQM
jgi:hypothetical protein